MTLANDDKTCDTDGAEHLAIQQAIPLEGETVNLQPYQEPPICLEAIEAAMLDEPQIDIPVQHHFGPGIYIREMFAPAGALILGHAHKCDHMNIMLQGKMAIVVDGEAKVIEAPYIFTGGPGRKIAYVIEDVVFQNVYATTETDLDAIEAQFIDKSATWHNAQIEAANMQAITDAVSAYLGGVN
jgi:hypothetical protein